MKGSASSLPGRALYPPGGLSFRNLSAANMHFGSRPLGLLEALPDVTGHFGIRDQNTGAGCGPSRCRLLARTTPLPVYWMRPKSGTRVAPGGVILTEQ